jgi:hypothetical protein
MTSNANGFNLADNTIQYPLNLNGLAIVSASTTAYGISGGNVSCANVGVSGFAYGWFGYYGSRQTVNNCCASGCVQVGFCAYQQSLLIGIGNMAANGCGTGIYIQFDSSFYSSGTGTVTANMNGGVGLQVQHGSTAYVGALYVYNNQNHGVYVITMSNLYAPAMTSQNNVGDGLAVNQRSTALVINSAIQNNSAYGVLCENYSQAIITGSLTNLNSAGATYPSANTALVTTAPLSCSYILN